MIRLHDLTAGYGGRPVVEGVTLDLVPGRVLALLGPNGSGKSTLVKAALGLREVEISAGEVLYDGVDVRRMRRREIAQKAALLSQSRDTPSIEALRMVLHGRFPYLAYPRQYGREDYALARSAMDTAGCRPFEGTYVDRLSGGQRQTVYQAMVLAQGAGTVFLDEPTTYLDVGHQLHTIQVARGLAAEGKAVVLILHDIGLALRGADRVGVLREGRLVQEGPPEEILESGVLDRVFGVRFHRLETPWGVQYFCTEEG